MSHNLTMPEEIEIVLMELEENESIAEEISKKSIRGNAQDGWFAGYIPANHASNQG